MISYCFECGTKLEYLASMKPKFCHNCGSPTGGQNQETRGTVGPRGHKGTPGVRGENVQDQELDDLDGDENLSVPQNLDGLEFEISFAESTTFKLGDIIEQSVRQAEATNEVPNPLNIPMQKGKRASQKKVLTQFQKEAGTLRQKPKKK